MCADAAGFLLSAVEPRAFVCVAFPFYLMWCTEWASIGFQYLYVCVCVLLLRCKKTMRPVWLIVGSLTEFTCNVCYGA